MVDEVALGGGGIGWTGEGAPGAHHPERAHIESQRKVRCLHASTGTATGGKTHANRGAGIDRATPVHNVGPYHHTMKQARANLPPTKTGRDG